MTEDKEMHVCIHGHHSDRLASGLCRECNRLRTTAYYHANKDSVSAQKKARRELANELLAAHQATTTK